VEKIHGKLLNENACNNDTDCGKVDGRCVLMRRDEILKAVSMMNEGCAIVK